LRNHQAVEFTNWFKFAYNDTVSGVDEVCCVDDCSCKNLGPIEFGRL